MNTKKKQRVRRIKSADGTRSNDSDKAAEVSDFTGERGGFSSCQTSNGTWETNPNGYNPIQGTKTRIYEWTDQGSPAFSSPFC